MRAWLFVWCGYLYTINKGQMWIVLPFCKVGILRMRQTSDKSESWRFWGPICFWVHHLFIIMVTIPRIILSSSWTATSRLHSELVFWDSCHKLRTVSFRRTPSWHHPAHRAMGSNHPAAIPSSSSYRDAGFSIKIMISASRAHGLVEKFHGILIKKCRFI